MSNKGLVLTGTRPPSVADFRPRTAPGKRGHYGYHTIAVKSNIDETLFQSHNPGRMSEQVSFKPPWAYKKKTPEEELMKPKGRPLLWSPQPSVSLSGDVVSNFSNIKANPYSNTANSKYKMAKHVPTYIDETLFGRGFEEPSFEAPWGDKKKTVRPYLWVPDSVNYEVNTEHAKKKRYRIGSRPNSAMGFRGELRSSNAKPVWKP